MQIFSITLLIADSPMNFQNAHSIHSPLWERRKRKAGGRSNPEIVFFHPSLSPLSSRDRRLAAFSRAIDDSTGQPRDLSPFYLILLEYTMKGVTPLV